MKTTEELKDSILEILENGTPWSSDDIPSKNFPYVADDIIKLFINERRHFIWMLLDAMENEEESKFHKNIVSRQLMLLNLQNIK